MIKFKKQLIVMNKILITFPC